MSWSRGRSSKNKDTRAQASKYCTGWFFEHPAGKYCANWRRWPCSRCVTWWNFSCTSVHIRKTAAPGLCHLNTRVFKRVSTFTFLCSYKVSQIKWCVSCFNLTLKDTAHVAFTSPPSSGHLRILWLWISMHHISSGTCELQVNVRIKVTVCKVQQDFSKTSFHFPLQQQVCHLVEFQLQLSPYKDTWEEASVW